MIEQLSKLKDKVNSLNFDLPETISEEDKQNLIDAMTKVETTFQALENTVYGAKE
jgi:hypothetical protein